MQGLFADPDGAERRFIWAWLHASVAILLLILGTTAGFAALRTMEIGGNLSEVTGYWLEFAVWLVLFTFAPVLHWIVIGSLYPRPALAAWLGWMCVGTVAWYICVVIADLSLYDAETGSPVLDTLGYAGVFLFDLSYSFGFIVALSAIAWRVGVAVALAAFGTASFLTVTSLSTAFDALTWQGDGLRYWGYGIDWSMAPRWALETIAHSCATSFAIIVGFRWQERDVESQIFD